MQCACPECGLLMGHRIKGLQSECCCPICGLVCRACLGTHSVLDRDSLRAMAEKVDEQFIEEIFSKGEEGEE